MVRSIRKRLISAVLSAALMTGMVPAASLNTAAASSVPEGFVYTKGTQFMMDRNTYYYGGTNCYYLTYKSNTAVKNVLNDASDMGLNVIRVWGHLDVGKKTDEVLEDGITPVFEGNNDNNGGVATKDGVYFQYWDPELNRPVVNEGENGLRRLDYVISEAEKRGIKLIITFTNYWEAFGGMGQYVKYYQMLNGETPDNNKLDEKQVCEFYTNETIKQWYKDYINTLVNHTNYYTGEKLKESEAVFAWELSNEPRCTIDGDGSNFCKDDILYNWVTEMSSYVKSVDPNHMVSIGDEGFYNLGYHEANDQKLPSAAYSGYYGVDFEKLMTIDTVDFGTPHMYVDQWGFKDGDDLEWIKRHAQTAQNAGKPVVLEEFGLTNKETRDSHYEDWLSIITGDYYDGIEYQGFNYWMIASWIDESEQAAFGDGRYYYSDYDQYTVYGPAEIEAKVGSPNARTLIVDAAAKMNAKNINNTAEISTDTVDRSNAVDVVADLNVMLGQFDGVTCDGKALSNGTDYSISGNIVTIDKDYFKTLELGNHTFKLIFTEGDSPAFVIKVTDSNVIDAELSAYTLDIDKSPYVVADVSVDMTLNGNEFRGIKNGKNTLADDTDYAVSNNTVTIKADYLKSLPKGENVLTFDFYEGNDRELVLNVSDSSTRVWEGEFDLGNWTNSLTIDKNLAEWMSGNLKFTLEDANGCQLQLNYVDSEGSVKKIIDYTNAFTADEYTMKLTSEQFEKLRSAEAIIIKGKNAIITAIDVEDGVRDSEYVPDDSSLVDSSSVADSSSKDESSSKADSSSTADSSSKEDSSSKADSSSVADTSSKPDESSNIAADGDPIIVSGIVQFNGSWESKAVEFEIPSDGKYLLEVKYQGNAGAYFKIKFDGVSNALWAEGNWVKDACGHDEWTDAFSKTKVVELAAGTHTVKFQGQDYAKFISFTATPVKDVIDESSTIDDSSEDDTSSVVDSSSEDDTSSQTDGSSVIDESSSNDDSSEIDPSPVEKPTFVKSTFSLEGVIGANLEYKISDTYVNGNYKIEVTAVSDKGDTKELTFDKNEKVGTNYVVTLPVKATDLTAEYEVTLAVKDAKGNEVTSVDTTVTVNAALNLLKSSTETGPLANALQTYGYYAQRNFGLEASDPIRRPADLSGIKRATVSAYKAQRNTVDNLPKSVPISTQSLLLEGQTTIRVYFGEIPENVDISKLKMVYTANGKTERSELQNNGTGYYADIANINAQELSNMYSIHVEEAGVQVSDELVYGAYSYVAANISSSDVNLQNTVKALYNYGEVAREYFNASNDDKYAQLDTKVTASTKENFADYVGTISNVDINGDKLYSQDDLTKDFSRFGNLYDKSLYDDNNGSDVGIVFCGWNTYNYLQDPSLDYKLSYFDDGSEYGSKRMTFIPTYFLDTYDEGIKVNGEHTLDTDTQAEIMAEALNRNVRLNYRLHIDPQRFAPDSDNYSKVDTEVPGSQWWRGEFTKVNPMGEDYLAMVNQGFEALEKTLAKVDTSKLVEPIRFDIGAELMTSIKNYTAEWNQLLAYCKAKVEASPRLKDNVILSYNFCHHIEYLMEIENHDDYFGRINGTGVTYLDRQDLLFVDDMDEESRQQLGEFIKGLDTFSISQYMPMDIFNAADIKDISKVTTTPEDVRDALLTHEQNFLQKVLIGKLGIAPDEIPPFHYGEYGMGIKGLTAPNVWDRTAWTDEELATYEVQRKHAEIALKGLMLYMQDERSVARSLALWLSGAPYDVINFYPGMNTGDAGHGYPGKEAYNEKAAQVLKDYWND